MSLAKMHAGGGVDYMLKNIARGDGNQISADQVGADDSLAAYYTAFGYPPGVWIGTGLAGLNDGRGLPANTLVSEATMGRLFGTGCDPVTGRQLGRRPIGKTSATKSMVGFDLTFSVPKSVSVLWGLADAPLRAVIEEAHHEAIGAVLASAEREVFRTRRGAGGAIQVPTRGMVAAGFDHFDSRDGDPQLHTAEQVEYRHAALADLRQSGVVSFQSRLRGYVASESFTTRESNTRTTLKDLSSIDYSIRIRGGATVTKYAVCGSENCDHRATASRCASRLV